jgi:hypothetical protein
VKFVSVIALVLMLSACRVQASAEVDAGADTCGTLDRSCPLNF